MKKLNKIITLMVLEIVLAIGLLSLSAFSKMLVAIIFPPIIGLTIFGIMLSLLDMDKYHVRTVNFIFGIFLVGMILVSTGIGFHYASDQINESFFPFETFFSLDDLLFTKDRLYYLDEMFSHWLMLAGCIAILGSIYLWMHFFKKHPLQKTDQEEVRSLSSFFLPIFLGSVLGATSAFGSIEAQIQIYFLIVMLALLPLVIYKLKMTNVHENTLSFPFLFLISAFGSNIGIIFSFIITSRAFPNVF